MRRLWGQIDSGVIYLWLLAVGLIVFGVALLTTAFPKAGFDGPVLCDGKVMGPHDYCNIIYNGSGSLHSYEGLRAEQLAGHGWELSGLLVGGLALLVGLALLAYLVRQSLSRS